MLTLALTIVRLGPPMASKSWQRTAGADRGACLALALPEPPALFLRRPAPYPLDGAGLEGVAEAGLLDIAAIAYRFGLSDFPEGRARRGDGKEKLGVGRRASSAGPPPGAVAGSAAPARLARMPSATAAGRHFRVLAMT